MLRLALGLLCVAVSDEEMKDLLPNDKIFSLPFGNLYSV